MIYTYLSSSKRPSISFNIVYSILEVSFVMFNRRINPIVHPPRHIVRDRFIPREVRHIHPIVHVNRHHIVNVPRHSSRHFRRDEFYDNGYPTRRFW